MKREPKELIDEFSSQIGICIRAINKLEKLIPEFEEELDDNDYRKLCKIWYELAITIEDLVKHIAYIAKNYFDIEWD